MNLDPKWVPMKWPCGPLALRAKEQGENSRGRREGDAGLRGPARALDILKGTPINCLVVEWAAGAPEDAAQQEALKPLIEAGRGKGISFVARNSAKDTPPQRHPPRPRAVPRL